MISNRYEAHTEEYYAQYEDTIRSGEARIPICFCIDISYSMGRILNPMEDMVHTGDTVYKDNQSWSMVRLKPGVPEQSPIVFLRKILKKMIKRFQSDPFLSHAAMIGIVTFCRYADYVIEFSAPQQITDSAIDRWIKKSFEYDETFMTRGLSMALDRLTQLNESLKNAGNESYKPVLIFMTDGEPDESDKKNALQIASEIKQKVENNELTVIPISIEAGREGEFFLQELTPSGRIFQMKTESEYEQVFQKITQRARTASRMISVDESSLRQEQSDSVDLTKNDETSSEYGVDYSKDINDLERLLNEMILE